MTEELPPFFTLRLAVAVDQAFWIALHHVAERATVVRQFGPWDEALQDEFARRNWHDERGKRQIIQVGGQDVGFWHVVEQPRDFYIANIVIHPDFQGRGIGRSLLKQAQEKARLAGKPLTLQTLFENTARQLYEKLGFVITGKTATHWLMRWEV